MPHAVCWILLTNLTDACSGLLPTACCSSSVSHLMVNAGWHLLLLLPPAICCLLLINQCLYTHICCLLHTAALSWVTWCWMLANTCCLLLSPTVCWLTDTFCLMSVAYFPSLYLILIVACYQLPSSPSFYLLTAAGRLILPNIYCLLPDATACSAAWYLMLNVANCLIVVDLWSKLGGNI